MIEFENVSFCYENGRPILENLNFAVQDGESVGLIGPNGAGKSTLLKLILGLLSGNGKILVNQMPVNKKNLAQIRKTIGYVLQNSDNQMFMPTVYEDMIFGPLNYGDTSEQAEQKVDKILKQFHLEDLKHQHNHKLSGGEKRMAAIAATLAMEPEIILMDEPSTALDPFNRRTVIHTINSLTQTKFIASHDLDMILDTCDRVILLSHRKIAADGKTEKILQNKELLEANHMELPLCLQRRGCCP